MKFAKRVFTVAGVYGLIVLVPQFFLEARTGRDYPPAITHPEYFYGFIAVTVAWQVVFLLIGRDPFRYRPLMLVAALLEKFPFVIASAILWTQGRLPLPILGGAAIDLVLGILFVIAYRATAAEISGTVTA